MILKRQNIWDILMATESYWCELLSSTLYFKGRHHDIVPEDKII